MPSERTRRRNSTLTAADIQVGVGAELLALCQTVTQDGSLSNNDILSLRNWLAANRHADLPSISFLISTINLIVADGKVTMDERRELYRAIETILPLDARKEATTYRRIVEAQQKAEKKAAALAEAEVQRLERERNRPLAKANFMVAGVFYEGRSEVVEEYVLGDERVFLARDPMNQFSRSAIEIRLQNGLQIGYVPESDAREFAPYLDQGCPHLAYVTKVLRGGKIPIPVVQAYIYSAESTIEGLTYYNQIPAKTILPLHDLLDVTLDEEDLR